MENITGMEGVDLPRSLKPQISLTWLWLT